MESRHEIKDFTKLMEEAQEDIDEHNDYSTAKLLFDIIKETSPKFYNEIMENKKANIVRSNHPLNSALAILTNDTCPPDINKYTVALIALAHSKSTSGISSFANESQWKNAIDNVLLPAYGEKASKAEVDIARTELYKMLEGKNLEALQKEALCVRSGDAMAPMAIRDGKLVMQDGNEIALEIIDQESFDKVTYENFKADINDKTEVSKFKDIIYDKDGNDIDGVVSTFSKKTHAGELNLDFDDTITDYTYDASLIVKDPLHYARSTRHAIIERLGEVVTFTNMGDNRTVEIVLPAEAQDTKVFDFYMDTIQESKKALLKGMDPASEEYKERVKFIKNNIFVTCKDENGNITYNESYNSYMEKHKAKDTSTDSQISQDIPSDTTDTTNTTEAKQEEANIIENYDDDKNIEIYKLYTSFSLA